MQMRRSMTVLLTVILALGLLSGCAPQQAGEETASPSMSAAPAEETRTVTDSIGREVELPAGEELTAVVSNAYNMELVNAIGAMDQVVGVDWYIWQDEQSWQGRFTEEMQVGKDPELDYEKIIALAPDVLILAENGGWEEAQRALEPFGIAVFVSNAYYTDEFLDTTLMLGEVLGHQEEARVLYDYFAQKLDYIDAQLEGVEKKTVYFEYRTLGRTTVPGDYFYYMIEYAHGDNVFQDAAANQVDPEAVVEANPQYIVKVSAPDVTSSYYPPTPEEHQAIREELIARPGWDEIDAVKEDNILLLSHYVHGGASKLVGCMYVAKFLYPEQLLDLHPEQVFHDWLTLFQHNDYIEGHTWPAFTLED